MAFREALKKLFLNIPWYRRQVYIEKYLRDNSKALSALKKEISKIQKAQLKKEEIEKIVEGRSSKAITDNVMFFDSLFSNRLESHLYNLGIEKEEEKKKPLFILGSGPSLNDCDVTKLKNCYTMSFNRSYIAFKDWGFEPTYFAGIDHVVNEDNAVEFKNLVLNSNIKRFFFARDDVALGNFMSWKTTLVELVHNYPPDLNFRKRLPAANSGLFGLQVALGVLGFKEVYLLGCDANYDEEVKGVKVEGHKYVSNMDSDSNHFRPDYFGKGRVYNKPDGNIGHLPAWKEFYERNIRNNPKGFRIYNCAKNGKLTFFEYRDFNDVVKNIKRYEMK